MPYAVDIDTVSQSVVSLLNTNATALGVKRVWYGQQELLKDFPCVVVIPADTRRIGNAMAMQVDIEFDLYLVVVHSLLTQSIAQRTASDLHMVRAIALLLHQNRTLGDTVILGTVIGESPQVIRHNPKSYLIGTQMTFNCKSRGRIGTDV